MNIDLFFCSCRSTNNSHRLSASTQDIFNEIRRAVTEINGDGEFYYGFLLQNERKHHINVYIYYNMYSQSPLRWIDHIEWAFIDDGTVWHSYLLRARYGFNALVVTAHICTAHVCQFKCLTSSTSLLCPFKRPTFLHSSPFIAQQFWINSVVWARVILPFPNPIEWNTPLTWMNTFLIIYSASVSELFYFLTFFIVIFSHHPSSVPVFNSCPLSASAKRITDKTKE